ncbi:NAD(P)-binding protein [Corynespora cassiicola Philippines]|uniref:NAD(P)-binding protein n=1 Tax=Corynespora cassiicola Philippines TaxID=1448308 RepID=A0A2T2P218_CORCC|nr:NAD(P)-binding protein [Corynespora cassiicola Philippines]
MQPNILVTGAAGYIGGSVIADFLSQNVIGKEYVTALVRTEAQQEVLSRLGIKVVRADLSDKEALTEAVLQNKINVVIHTASSMDPSYSLPLISALSKRKEQGEPETFFLHTSGYSAFFHHLGWPSTLNSDTGPVFPKIKELGDSFPLRRTDVTITEHGRACGVKTFIVMPPTVYGKGTGPGNTVSFPLRLLVTGLLKAGEVGKFSENKQHFVTHISDVVSLCARIIQNIRQGNALAHGEQGFYLAMEPFVYWHDVHERLAAALHARGLVGSPEVKTWRSYDEASEKMGFPPEFVQMLWDGTCTMAPSRSQAIGWRPTRDGSYFMESIEDDIDAVLEERNAGA